MAGITSVVAQPTKGIYLVNGSTNLIDFVELVSSVPGEGLEELVRHIGQRMDLSPSFSGRGPDGGRDLFFTESVAGSVSKRKIKWLVSCKDKAMSGQAVTEADLPQPGVRDKVIQHKADGFLLVTTTTPSGAAKALLDGLDKGDGGEIYTCVWDKSELTRILLRPENSDLVKQFFPETTAELQASRLWKRRCLHWAINFLPQC